MKNHKKKPKKKIKKFDNKKYHSAIINHSFKEDEKHTHTERNKRNVFEKQNHINSKWLTHIENCGTHKRWNAERACELIAFTTCL